MTTDEIARTLVKYEKAIKNTEKEIKKVKSPLEEKLVKLKEKKEKLNAALLKRVKVSENKEVRVGKHRYGLMTTPGKITIIGEVKDIPAKYWKRVKPAADITKIKKDMKDDKINPEKENWFKFTQETTLKHTILKEEE